MYVQEMLLLMTDKRKGEYSDIVRCKESCKYDDFEAEITSSVVSCHQMSILESST